MEDRQMHGSSSSSSSSAGRPRRGAPNGGAAAAAAADVDADDAAIAEPGDGRSDTGSEDNISVDSYISEGFDGSDEDELSESEDDDDDASASSFGWYDSEDEDDQSGLLKIMVNSFGEAAELLEESGGVPPIDRLGVFTPTDDETDARVVRRFVAALGREGGRAVRRIEFRDVDWTGMPEEDVTRLFGKVLPFHPTLEAVAGDLPTPCVTLLASSIRTENRSPLTKLDLRGGTFDRSCAQAIADMIRRNAPITTLHIYPSPRRGLEAVYCKLICQAVRHNTNLRVLNLGVKETFADTVDQVASSSTLRELVVSAEDLSDECVASIATQLRTNTAMQLIFLCKATKALPGHQSHPFRPIMETLETYNFTLQNATWHWEDPQQDALRGTDHNFLVSVMGRNTRIHRALEQLPGYHVAPTILWPRVLGMVSPLPTLLYRFLRKGDVNTLCSLLERDGSATGQKKRGRAIDHGDGGSK
jgi:hypothetical protein